MKKPDFNNDQAINEGWSINEAGLGDDAFRLEKLDAMDLFGSDQDAWKYVIERALFGSIYHIKALKFIEVNGAKDFALIETHASLMGICNNLTHLFEGLPTEMTDAEKVNWVHSQLQEIIQGNDVDTAMMLEFLEDVRKTLTGDQDSVPVPASASPARFNHAYDFAFEVMSDDENAEDVTADMLIEGLRHRIDRIVKNDKAEMLEACGWIDTMDESGNVEEAA